MEWEEYHRSWRVCTLQKSDKTRGWSGPAGQCVLISGWRGPYQSWGESCLDPTVREKQVQLGGASGQEKPGLNAKSVLGAQRAPAKAPTGMRAESVSPLLVWPSCPRQSMSLNNTPKVSLSAEWREGGLGSLKGGLLAEVRKALQSTSRKSPS